MREAMTLILQELIELEAAQAIGAGRSERTDDRNRGGVWEASTPPWASRAAPSRPSRRRSWTKAPTAGCSRPGRPIVRGDAAAVGRPRGHPSRRAARASHGSVGTAPSRASPASLCCVGGPQLSAIRALC
jgi:hypothetical protein